MGRNGDDDLKALARRIYSLDNFLIKSSFVPLSVNRCTNKVSLFEFLWSLDKYCGAYS